MYSIGLHEIRELRDVVQQEGHQGQFFVARQIAVTQAKLFRVFRAIVGRHPYPQQQYLGARRRREVDHAQQIGAHLRDGQSAQAVIAAQFQNDDLGVMQVERPRQPREAACGGLPANAGVDDLVTVISILEPRLQQRHPALFYARQPVAGTDAIAEHENHRRFGLGRNGHKHRQQDQKPFHRRSSMQDQIVLEAKNVSKTVASPEGQLTILADVSLSVRTQETLAIVGASGAGKSTLLALLAGLDSPSAGRVLIAGIDITLLDEDGRAAIRGKHVGFVFQSFHLIPSLTAVENVMLPLELRQSRDARAAAVTALAQVGLTPRLAHYPKQLSGGEQQRVAIARAFVTHPAVLFADEPTGNLDTATGQRITDLLFELNRSTGSTLVLVTHDRELAARCNRMLQLDAGHTVN